ncbi:hypothetical protein TPR58_20935, partial [Sphingomonas sp. HF-S3]
MKLSISLVDGFPYSTRVHEFPVNIEISTEQPIEIWSRVVVSGAHLEKEDDQEFFLGFSMLVSPARRELAPLLPSAPMHMQVDVFEHDSDFTEYLPGKYRCKIQVLVGKKSDEGITMITLTGPVRIFVCGRAVEHYAAMALMKRSPKMTANWAFAMDHSRGG